jgi:dipeptidyl aminopeptidase/acylaminoacyl peptidase
VTQSDYARAEQLLSWNAANKVYGMESGFFGLLPTVKWLEGDRFVYRNKVSEGTEFVFVDPSRSVRRPAFDHARLAAVLSVAADTSYLPYKLPFQEFEYLEGRRSIEFFVADSVRWRCNLTSYDCTGPDSIPKRPATETLSPDGEWVAFERDENLWVRSVENGEEIQLSQDGETDYGYAVIPEGCCQEITSRRQGLKRPPTLRWSPDSRRIATHRYDERKVERLHLLEAAPGRPKLHSYAYALPGDSIVPMYDIYIFDVESQSSVRVDIDPMVGDFTSADTLWAAVAWNGDGTKLYFTRRSRDFKQYDLFVADAVTGETRHILEETQPTYVELVWMSIGQPNWRVLADRELIWYSERDGWGHLYLYDVDTGEFRNQITSGPWMVSQLLHVDEAARWVYFTAVGRERNRNPYFPHLYRVRLDGSGLELLSPENASHSVAATPSGRFFLDTYSRRDTAAVTVLRDVTGRVVQTVNEGDVTALAEAGWNPPTPFKVKGRDGVTDVYGYLYFPSNFDPEKKYPVVDYVYPGPQIGSVITHGFIASPAGEVQAFAELGFIMFTVDAMGTPLRAKAYHDSYYGNMGDNGIPDHISALKLLAVEYPQIDLDRVGIYGHSGGGFASTDAILRYPEFFKVAVSGAGNHDQRGYHFPWGEKYHGLLVRDSVSGGDNYDSQANQNLAANLRGKLMLTYGSLDDNVHPNMTLMVVNELIKHNKDFDMLVFPNRNHGYASEPYVVRRTWDYFVRHLMGAEPPREYKISPPGR